MKKYMSYAISFGASSALLVGMVACASKDAVKSVLPETVQGVALLQVHSETVPETLEVVGTVQPAETAQLAPQMMGTITAVNVTEGSRVTAGEVLARISGALPQAGLQQAQAGLSAAQHQVSAAESAQSLAASTMQRYELLHERKSVSAQEYDQVRQQLQAAKAQLDVAKAGEAQAKAAVLQATSTLAFTEIRAPFAGIVTKRMVDPGALASPGMPVFSIESVGRYHLETTVDESNLSSIHPGEKAEVRIDAIPHGSMTGRVAQIYPAGDAESRSFTVKIELPKNMALRSGLYGRASFQHGRSASISVPKAAIVRQGNLTGVYVVAPDKIAQIRYVTLGNDSGDSVEVLSGLGAGETIVASPDGRELGGKRIEVQQ